MNSPLFDEWVAEERKEAAQKTERELHKKYIIDLLTEKFDFVPKSVRESINSIDDVTLLEEILKKIIKVDTLKNYILLLDKAKNMN